MRSASASLTWKYRGGAGSAISVFPYLLTDEIGVCQCYLHHIGVYQFDPVTFTREEPHVGSTETRKTPRLAVLVGIAAASVGVIYGYDLSNIAGAMLFIPKEFDLDTAGVQWITTMVVIGEIAGAIIGGWLANR